MTKDTPSRRSLILGAAAAATTVPIATILTPEAVIAASTAAPPGTGHRGPAHDWLDAFAKKKNYGIDRTANRA